jgi:DegV family protein with EDD domain
MQELSGYALRRALMCGIQNVISHRDEINRINVFPVPDGDTGTNLAFTLGATLPSLRRPRVSVAGEVLKRFANEAVDGARGNSGAIVAQFFQGLAERAGNGGRLTLAQLADAVAHGALSAREALAEPREGTILSVLTAFAHELGQSVALGARDFGSAFAQALARARVALGDTPRQLAVLRSAGVVDAGALGFVDLLEGVDDFIRRGRVALRAQGDDSQAEPGVDAPDVLHGPGDVHGYCCECMVSADPVDRLGLKAALLALPLSSLVLAGMREKLRVHAHLDHPELLFDVCERFGRVSSIKADDLRRQAASAANHSRVALVTDSGADLPAEELERLCIHLVPVRVSIGARDYLDKVSLGAREFFREVRDSPIPPRTSQPPPGDFRRLFEFLLSHHESVVYAGLARRLSGTLQAGESAAERCAPGRVSVVDSLNGGCAQGLIALDAAEAAAAGFDAAAVVRRVERMRARTRLLGAIRDISFGVRGGRAPRLAIPLTRYTGLKPIICSRRNGRIGLAGAMRAGDDFPERFAARVARRLDPGRRWRVLMTHCDCPEDGERLQARLLALAPDIERHWLIEAGAAIGAHAGPGSLVVGIQESLPLERDA